jgi:hypothetical protein
MIMPIHIDAMKRLCTVNDNHPTKRTCVTHNIYLPTDIQMHIIDMCTQNNDQLRHTISTIKAIAMTNQQCYILYNNQRFIDDLIERLCKKLRCSHETVAGALHTPAVNNRLTLQNKLKLLCLKNNFYLDNKQKLAELSGHGVNLGFTYNHKNQPQTLVMIAYDNNNRLLWLEEKSNFNQETPQNKTFLMMVTQYPILYRSKAIIEQVRVNINHQNSKGETAFLHCIKNRKNHRVSHVFMETIKIFLKNGADPTLADKSGKTPLAAANKIQESSDKKEAVIQLIQEAIAQQARIN